MEIICVDETKLDSSFPNSQFRIDGYIFPPYQRDRDNNGGLFDYKKTLETKLSQTVCLELTLSNKKMVYTVYV